jgi:hypothetical protein
MFRKLMGAAAALAILATAATTVATTTAHAEFPEREMLGVVMWGAGGATDTVARAVNPAAEEALGKPVVVLNKSGGAGAISTAYVQAAPADGYTFLYGAENPQLHPVMGVSDIDYSKFWPVNILGPRRRRDHGAGGLEVQDHARVAGRHQGQPRQRQDGLNRPRRPAQHDQRADQERRGLRGHRHSVRW